MKRYTGQQALYEAISRSRAKAKQGSILEKLRPEPSKPGQPAAEESKLPVESLPASEQTPEPAIPVLTDPEVAEITPLPAVEQEGETGPAAETSPEPVPEVLAEPPEPVELSVKPRPIERLAHPAQPKPVQAWLRPRPVQLNEGRIEVSVPYYVGIIAGLVVLVVVLAAFRLGQARSGGPAVAAGGQVPAATRPVVPANPTVRPGPQSTTTADRPQPSPPVSGTTQQNVAAAKPQGDHWIVLAQYRRQEDFEPVIQHFAEHGIDLGVVSLARAREVFTQEGFNVGALPSGDGFLLVTKDAFENPKLAGTDGSKMIQRIVEVGALYKGKARSGYESFAPNYFKDAYPMKIR